MKMHVRGEASVSLIQYFLGTLLLLCGSLTYAQENSAAPLLSPEEAFTFSVESTQTDQARLRW